MTWSDEPTNAQLSSLYNMIKWKATGDSATRAIQWLAERATRREVSDELKRVRELYAKHALNATNCFVGEIWEGFPYAKEQE